MIMHSKEDSYGEGSPSSFFLQDHLSPTTAGIAEQHQFIRSGKLYKQWRRTVFEKMGHGCIVRSKRVGPDAERLETHRGSAMPQTGNNASSQHYFTTIMCKENKGSVNCTQWLGCGLVGKRVVHYWLRGTNLVVAWGKV